MGSLDTSTPVPGRPAGHPAVFHPRAGGRPDRPVQQGGRPAAAQRSSIIYQSTQGFSLQFAESAASYRALAAWAQRFGAVLASEDRTDRRASRAGTSGSPSTCSASRSRRTPTSRSPRPAAEIRISAGPGRRPSPGPASQNLPYPYQRAKERFGMSNATSATPGRVVLDWRHGSVGPAEPCVLCGRPGDLPVPGQGRALPQGLRRSLDHRPGRQPSDPRPAHRRPHPQTERGTGMNFRVIYHQPVCPDCGSGQISTEDIDTTDGFTETAHICNDCGAAWPVACIAEHLRPETSPADRHPRRTWCCGSTPARPVPARPHGCTGARAVTST